TAAENAVAAAGAPGAAALVAAQAVAQAARAAVAGAANPGAVATAAEGAVTAAAAAGAAAAAPVGRARLNADGLNLEGAYEGSWANRLRARVALDTRPVGPGEPPNSLFNLQVRDDATGRVEQFRNVSVVPGHPRQVDRVLENESNLVRVRGALPGAR